MTRKKSLNSTSPRLVARMTVTLAWLPELPPMPISMGMKPVRAAQAASWFSNAVRIMAVKVALTIRTVSHGMRLFQVSKTLVLK